MIVGEGRGGGKLLSKCYAGTNKVAKRWSLGRILSSNRAPVRAL